MRKLLSMSTLWITFLSGCGGSAVPEPNPNETPNSSSSSSSSSGNGASTGQLERWNYVLGINVAGGHYVSKNKHAYEADKYFSGGTTHTLTNQVSATADQTLYQSERWGASKYEIPVGSGRFQVVLKFAELYWTANNQRMFNVAIEGNIVTQNLDIFSQVGDYTAYDIKYPNVMVNDGNLSIHLTDVTASATLSAIEIYADKDNAMRFSNQTIRDGEGIYNASCASCHGPSGKGNGAFPPLIKSKCKSCSSPAALISTISKTMPLGGNTCTGECASNVAGFILANFDDAPSNAECRVQYAPIRRLTRFEYSNTVQDLLGDNTRPGNGLPSEEIGNGFGNDALSMSVSSLLAEQYAKVATDIANRVVNNQSLWERLHSCVRNVSGGNENSCADQVINQLLPRAFRRAVTNTERQAFIELHRSLNRSVNFKTSIAGVIEAVLQSPEFLYRAELGKNVNGRLKPTDHEMASRLSYFFWGSMPDDALLQAAAQGRLSTPEQIKTQAERMLNDQRSRNMIRYFFDAYLPISGLSHLERDSNEFPTFNAMVGELMREETQSFLEHIIFDGAGDWKTALTAPYSFMNDKLANFYGINGVSGSHFRQVPTDANQRKGLLTHAGVMAGTIHSQKTNPVTRGAYVMKKLLCVNIPLPVGDVADEITPPDPNSGATARERFTKHSEDAVCRSCHNLIDPVGLVFENYDPIGLYRTHENNVRIDASGELPGTGVPVNNATELVTMIANDSRTYQCFAYNWANFAYGKTIGASESCIKDTVTKKFTSTGSNIKQLLVDLTQTDAFLYLPSSHRQ